jgi:hypothetical protein
MLALDRADGASLPAGTARLRASFGGGLRAQFQLALTRQVLLGLIAAADYLPAAWGGSFWFEQSPGLPAVEIFQASRLRLMVGVGVSWAVF